MNIMNKAAARLLALGLLLFLTHHGQAANITPQQPGEGQSGSMSGLPTIAGGLTTSINPRNGSAVATIPFALPAARGFVQPVLALSYDSALVDGEAGTGWSLAIPAIARHALWGFPSYKDPGPNQAITADVDPMEFGGQPLVPICTVGISSCPPSETMPAWANGWHYFRQRIDDLHARFFWAPDGLSWRVEHKSGEMAEFGVVTGIQQDAGGVDAELTQPPFRWNLVRKWDAVTGQIGPRNIVRYVWKHLGNLGRGYLTDIYDTGLASSPGFEAQGFAHHTRLVWEPQPFPVLTGGNTIFAPHDQRLAGVDVSSKDLAAIGPRHLVRRYHLSYKAASHHSYLVRVQEEGACTVDSPIVEQGDESLPASNCERFPYVSMSYSNFALGEPLQSPLCSSMESLPTTSGQGPSAKTALLDFNQDGLVDVVQPASASKKPQKLFLNKTQLSNTRLVTGHALEPHDLTTLQCNLANSSLLAQGFVSAIGDWFLRSSEWYQGSLNTRTASVFFPLASPGTCNSDADCCATQCIANQCQGAPWLWEGDAAALEWRPTFSGLQLMPQIEELAVDINSDGLLDTIARRTSNAAVPLRFSTTLGQGVYLFDTAVNVTPANTNSIYEAYADMNGDGLPDHVWPISSTGMTYEPGDGRGGFLPSVLMSIPPLGATDSFIRFAFFHDLDGDGLADLISEHLGNLAYWHNIDGQSFDLPTSAVFNGKLVSLNGNMKLSVGDMNGNGTDDFVVGDEQCGHCYEFWDCGAAIGPDVGLLTSIASGMGLFTTIQYANTADLDAVWQWKTHIPRSMRVVQSISTTVGGFGFPGLASAASERVFFYSDPIYVGSRHALHGFRRVRVRTSASPFANADATAAQHVQSETTYLIPPDFIFPPGAGTFLDRLLPPLPYQIDVFGDASSNSDMTGLSPPSSIYKTTTVLHYKVEEVLRGVTGETITSTYPDSTDVYIYDTDNFTRQDQTLNQGIVDFIFFKTPCTGGNCKDDIPINGTITLHSNKYEHLRTTQSIDEFGNIHESENLGRVNVDPTITTHFQWQLAPQTDWTWRIQSQSTDPFGNGFARTKVFIYDTFGNVIDEYATLGGTLPLVRHHENANKAIAPPPVHASQNGSIHVVHRDYDVFGNITQELGPNGQCTALDYDPAYRQLTKSRKVFTDGNGCSGNSLSTETTFNRQFAVPTMLVDSTGALTQFEYDGFGRIMRRLDPDPQTIGLTSSIVTIDYSPRATGEIQQDQDTGFQRTHVTDPSGETWTYTDGAGKAFAVLNKADLNAGDAGEWRVSGFSHLTTVGEIVTFAPWFYTGSPLSVTFLPPQNQPTEVTAFEIFGRPRTHVTRDGTTTARYTYGPLLVQAAEVDGGNNIVHSSTAAWNGHGRMISVQHPTASDVRTVDFFYQSTGEIVRMRQSTLNGKDALERTMDYDSLGGLVASHDPNLGPIGWHYAYDDSGRLVGSSDPRGCGKNITYDGLDRVTSEDWSPCLDSQAAYTAPLLFGDGTEALFIYDTPEQQVALPSAFRGQLAAVYDLGSHTQFDYDGRGRGIATSRQIVNPGAPSSLLSNRYAPRYFSKSSSFDDANRVVSESTGADVQELLGINALSEVGYRYTDAGLIRGIDSSYGPLILQVDYDVEGLARKTYLGDRAKTHIDVMPDARRRTSSLLIARGPPASSPQCGDWGTPCGSYAPPQGNTPTTLQETLENLTFDWDRYNKLKGLADGRTPSEWPDGFQPVDRTFDYDEYTRSLLKITYSPHGNNQQISPFQTEEANGDTRPLPHQVLPTRVASQSYHYDWANRPDSTDDDEHALFDRSLGSITYAPGTHQIQTAGAGTIRPTYDSGGNLVNLIVDRSGSNFQCSVAQKCTQRFVFDWDEVGQLARARRWDYSTLPQNDPPWPQVPAPTPDIDLVYGYSQGGRVLKSLVTGSGILHTLDVFDSLRLERTSFTQGDYVRSPETESVYLGSLAHVVYIPEDVPSLTSGHRRVLLLLGDHIGSTSSVVDHETGELVERVTYTGYGSTDSDYRPSRWASVREQTRYTGKEDDFEVGLTYFGARYYSPYLNRWVSPDPLVVHASAGFDPYSFVQNGPSASVDPSGLCSFDNLSGDSCWPFPVFSFNIDDPSGPPSSPWTTGRQTNDPYAHYGSGQSGQITPVPAVPYQDLRYNYNHNVRGEPGDWSNNLDQVQSWLGWQAPTTFGMNWDAYEGLREGFSDRAWWLLGFEALGSAQLLIPAVPLLPELGAEAVALKDGLYTIPNRFLGSSLGRWLNPTIYSGVGKVVLSAVDALSDTPTGTGASLGGGGGGAHPPTGGGGGGGFNVPAAKRALFLTNEKDLGTPAQRALEALSRFRQGKLTIPAGLTRQDLLGYRRIAVDVLRRAAGISPQALKNAQDVQQPRIDLIDEILASGGP